MTKKDYILIAQTIRRVKLACINGDVQNALALEHFVNLLCPELKIDNVRFDEKRFREAALP